MPKQWVTFCALWLVACGSSGSPGRGAAELVADAATEDLDAGSPHDGGVDLDSATRDAGPSIDSGAASDAGDHDGAVPRDGAVPHDGAAPRDAAVATDAAGNDGGENCVPVVAKPPLTRGPIDIVWAIDSSGSMADEYLNVANNLGAFAESIEESPADPHVVMMHLFGVLTDPVATTPFGSDPTRYKYLPVDVDSWNSLSVLLGQFPNYRTFLRPGAPTHLIVVSDDESNPLQGGLLAEDFKAQMESKLGHEFVFHAIVADGKNGCLGMNVGTQYLALAQQTGGVGLPICASDWSALFDKLQTAVIGSTPLSCEIDIPEPPAGAVFAPEKLQVHFKPAGGSDAEFPRAASAAECGNETAWYYDNAAGPTRIVLCPSACTAVTAGGSLGVAFGCSPSGP